MIPKVTSQWILESAIGSKGLKLVHNVSIPQLAEHDVLMKVHAVALNSRDNQIANGKYMFKSKGAVIPCSDCAGEIKAVGSKVSRFQPGSRAASTFHPRWHYGRLSSRDQLSQLGVLEDGVLKQYAVFHEDSLVALPGNVNFLEGCTLPGAAVTAWSALFGSNRPCKPGDIVLIQGSGGVSLFACQFAHAAGATVIATTGALGGEREQRLRALGAKEVVSYRDPKWGSKVKNLTPSGRGVDFIIETSGAGDQDARCLAVGGQIAAIGGNGASGGNVFDMRAIVGEVRKITVGNREQFEEMNRAIEGCKIRPVVDEKTFGWTEARAAFDYAESGKMWGKVVIRVADGNDAIQGKL
ncbi:putative quinone oxidoreductase [Rhizodiscina lignyota]|uniref:Quinone oxidoreductase n=1 Tax=Rhizodiscina lignyota TaxID=1504668 RepID=A0A9P4I9Q6_9PEZI|nr:putative quinone oxidoreductase [Rhizodiscina lignyota]